MIPVIQDINLTKTEVWKRQKSSFGEDVGVRAS